MRSQKHDRRSNRRERKIEGRRLSVQNFFFKNFTPPGREVVDWLQLRGVYGPAISTPVSIRMGHVSFDPLGQTFQPDTLGAPALILPIIDEGRIVDVAAWHAGGGRMATRFGIGHSIGQGQIARDGLGTTGRALPIFRNPLGWLRENRCGLVIVDWKLAAHALSGLIIEAEDTDHENELSEKLKLPRPIVLRKKRGTSGISNPDASADDCRRASTQDVPSDKVHRSTVPA